MASLGRNELDCLWRNTLFEIVLFLQRPGMGGVSIAWQVLSWDLKTPRTREFGYCNVHVDGLVQDVSNSSALAMELL